MNIKESYTHEDVKRLVEEASDVLAALSDGYRIAPNGVFVNGLAKALDPFLPDPEEELLEAMAEARWRGMSDYPSWLEMGPAAKQPIINAMRPVLAVVKERGLLT